METSKDMPTTVDLANNLVNYMVVEEPVQAEQDDSDDQEAAKRPKTRTVPAAKEYRHELPQYLADFDQPEESPAYHRALRAMEKLPPPPALPGFLAKPILNAPTVVREDNSVLILPPNHTVLNHLATCSIKNNILSVSATTRYKAKVGAVEGEALGWGVAGRLTRDSMSPPSSTSRAPWASRSAKAPAMMEVSWGPSVESRRAMAATVLGVASTLSHPWMAVS
jgi:hypothetical protein